MARKAAELPNTPAQLVRRRPVALTRPVGQGSPKKDKRLFLRIGIEHQWRTLSSVTIKKIIPEKAGVAPSAILVMTQVRSGLAIEYTSGALRESMLRVGSSMEMEKVTIKSSSEWMSVIVPHVPLFIRTLDGSIEVTSEMVKMECQAVYGVTSIQVRPNKFKLGQYSTSWIVHFKQVPTNLKFRLFDESGPAMPFSRRRPIEQFQRCWGFHSTRNCTRELRCERCSDKHKKTGYTANIPKCAACAGLHGASSFDCIARQIRRNGYVTLRTPAELRMVW